MIQANGRADTLAKKGSGMHYKNQFMLDSIDSEFKAMVHIGKFVTHAYDFYRSRVMTERIGINPYARQGPEAHLHSYG